MYKGICIILSMLLLFTIAGCTSTQKGAVIGGLGGAGVGAIIGNQSGQIAGGAAIGGVAGALGGALIGSQME